MNGTIARRVSKRGLGWLAAVFLGASLTGCATRELNAKAFQALPIQVPGVRIVYENARLVSERPDYYQPTRDRIVELLNHSVETQMPQTLRAAGIESVFASVKLGERVDWSTPALASARADWPVLLVTPLGALKVCAGSGCSHQLRVRLTLAKEVDNQKLQALWITDIEEPYMVSAFAYQARYDELAQHMNKAVLKAVVPLRTAVTAATAPH